MSLVATSHCSDNSPSVDRPCTEGFCRVSPVSAFDSLRKVWGSATDDVWAVGDRGAITHWDGKSWQLRDSGTTAWLAAVWGSSRSDLWVGGEQGLLLHGDGGTWQRVDLDTTGWISDLWGSAADDVWAAISDGTLAHYDGVAWQKVAIDGRPFFTSLWGSAKDDVWAVSQNSMTGNNIFHFDGRAWSPSVPEGIVTDVLWTVWGTGPADVWATGYRDQTGQGLFKIQSFVLHWDGMTWTDTLASSPFGTNQITTVGGTSAEVWAVMEATDYSGTTTLLRWNGKTWTPDPSSSPRGLGLSAIWGNASGELWFAGDQGTLLHRVGGTWQSVWDAARALTGVAGSSPQDVWVTGELGALLHFDGSTWSAIPTDTTSSLRGVWAADAGNVWAVGDAGTVVHFTGNQATSMTLPQTSSLFAVWGSAANDVWAAGDSGTLLHWDGTTWTMQTNLTGLPLRSIWGSSSGDIWAVGGQIPAGGGQGTGVIVRWNGTAWQPVGPSQLNFTGALPAFFSVHGSSATDVWMTSQEAVFHWDGMRLSQVLRSDNLPGEFFQELPPIWIATWGKSSADYFVTSQDGQIAHLPDGTQRPQINATYARQEPLLAIWGDGGNGMWAVGQAGTLLCGTLDGTPCGAGVSTAP